MFEVPLLLMAREGYDHLKSLKSSMIFAVGLVRELPGHSCDNRGLTYKMAKLKCQPHACGKCMIADIAVRLDSFIIHER